LGRMDAGGMRLEYTEMAYVLLWGLSYLSNLEPSLGAWVFAVSPFQGLPMAYRTVEIE
jgi:hypothetical protein